MVRWGCDKDRRHKVQVGGMTTNISGVEVEIITRWKSFLLPNITFRPGVTEVKSGPS